ncbi:MAG: TonB-dependent receptor [Burkholderiales bacterium]|nr:TonB-dependent receptor [Burkholderiales bacterium]
MLSVPFGRRALVIAVLCTLSVSTHARQSSPVQAPATPATRVPPKVETIEVKALPLPTPLNELTQPVTVLDAEDLRRKRAASIGDTLAGETGVQSSAFGPASGRPVIRGMDGARVRVLQNGVGTLDVSTLSPDHMVTSEAAQSEQIEILRGPASLLYGSGAIGGVVNVVSNLVPTAPKQGVSGEAELRASSGDRGRFGSATLEGGNGDVAWHLDGFRRRAKDYEIPGRIVADDPDSASVRLPGSDLDAEGAGAGVAFTRGGGFLGAGVSGLRNTYGLPTGEGTFIKLKQSRVELAGDMPRPVTGIDLVKFRAARGDYEHSEIEPDGEVATTFKNKGDEARVEIRHAPLAGWKGALGLQWQDRKVSAVGEEAYLPPTKSDALGFFIVEELPVKTASGDWTFSIGARTEREKLRPDADLPRRNFNLASYSVGAGWQFSPGHRLSVHATHAERAASAEELYAFGPHLATATFDIGNPDLGRESSRNIDVTLQRTEGPLRWKVNLFSNRMKNYIFAASIDSDGDGIADRVDAEGELDADGELLIQTLGQADATFRGYEAELSWRPNAGGFSARVFTDRVRATLKNGGNLPRISPARLGVELAQTWAAWTARVSAIRVQRAQRLAELETPTPGYTRVDAELAWQTSLAGAGDWKVFLQGRNLLDKEIRLHTSYLKDIAPQPGRAFTLGVRATF